MRLRLNRFLPVLAALGVLSGAALASAATTQRYTGKVKGAGHVSFQLLNGKVQRFQASMTLICVSVAPVRSSTDVYVIAQDGSAKLDHKGQFSFKINLPKQQFKDKNGKIIATFYSVKASVKGKVSGRSASGTAKVTYNKNALSGGTIVVVSCTSGKTDITWAAKRK